MRYASRPVLRSGRENNVAVQHLPWSLDVTSKVINNVPCAACLTPDHTLNLHLKLAVC